MSTEKDARELVIITELAQMLGKAVTVYNKTTGEAFGLDGQTLIDIAAQSISKSQSITDDTGSTTKVPVVAAVETELNKKVSLSENQAVAGIKTFSSSPIVPTPTANTQAAHKKYVDDLIAGRQVALTFGIADTNAVRINAADVAEGDFARFTASGLQGRSAAEVLSDIGAESITKKNVANGYVGLNASTKIDNAYLPDTILGQLKYGGTFSVTGIITSDYASLNGQNITLISVSDYFGFYFISSAGGSLLGFSFQVGDWAVSNGSAGWAKIDNTDAVTSVAGRIGAITLTKADITDFAHNHDERYFTETESDVRYHPLGGRTDLDISVKNITFGATNKAGQAVNLTMSWSQAQGTFDMQLPDGVTGQMFQELHIYAKCSETINDMDVVQFAGAEGDHIKIKKAVPAEIRALPKLLLGVATNNGVAGDFIYITTYGYINSIATGTWSAGDILYYDSSNGTNGAMTNIRPVAPNPIVVVGAVIKTSTGGTANGRIIVRPEWYGTTRQKDDVYAPTITTGDILRWATNRFEAYNIDTALSTKMSTNDYPDIVAIEAISGVTGLLKKTAANTWSLDTNSYSLTSHNHSGVYEPVFSKNTAFNKNFGTSAGTVAEGNDSRILNGQTAYGWGNHASAGYAMASALTNHINDTSPHLSSDERTYFNKLKSYLKIASDNTSMYSTLNFYSESGVSAFGIGSGGGGGGGVDIIDNLVSVRTDAALSANQGRILNGYISLKQPQLNGTGLVRMNGTSVSYDNNTYALSSALSSHTGNTSNPHSVTYTQVGALSSTALDYLKIAHSGTNITPDDVTINYIGYTGGVNLYGQTDGGLLASIYSVAWQHQIFGDFRTGQIAVRGKNAGVWQGWRAVLDASNYSTYTDSRYYTETEIGNFFGGSASISGYNKSNWDTAYGWGNHAGLYLPLSGGTLTANTFFTTLSAYSYNTAILQGNWLGTGYWGFGSDGNHTIKIDQINGLGSTQAFADAIDVTLKLGTKTVLDSSNYSAYAIPINGGNLTASLSTNYVPRWDATAGKFENSNIFQKAGTSGNIGIATSNPYKLFTVSSADMNSGIGQAEIIRIAATAQGVGYRSELGFSQYPDAYFSSVVIGTIITSTSGYCNNAFYIATRELATDTAPIERFRVSANGNVDVGYGGVRSEEFAVAGSIYASSYIESASYITAPTLKATTAIEIGAGWKALQNGTSLDLQYGGVLKARLDSSGNITAVGGVTAFAI